MPAVELPYIIAAIRFREDQEFLGKDEYTRIIESVSPDRALHVLVDTIYGKSLHATPSSQNVFQALIEHLIETRAWLADQLEKPAILQFISARYDGINLASALIARLHGKSNAGELSPLGFIDHSVINSVIWNNLGWDFIPVSWHPFLRNQLDGMKSMTPEDKESQQRILAESQQATIDIMKQLASSQLMKDVTRLYEDHVTVDTILRQNNEFIDTEKDLEWHGINKNSSNESVAQSLVQAGYTTFTTDSIRQLRENISSASYEKAWDESFLRTISPYKYESFGIDAILSYWFAKELEVKHIRILLSGRLNQLPKEELHSLERSLYLASV